MVGAATDPYQPAEGRYRLTRGCLEAFAAARNPFSIITRGPMIVRDVDVLAEASRRADVHVTFSVPTLDDDDLADHGARDRAAPAAAAGAAHARRRRDRRRRRDGPDPARAVGPAGAPPRRREGRPRRRRDRRSGRTSCTSGRGPASTSSRTSPATGRSCCRATSGCTPAGRTSARRRSSPSGGRSRTSATGSRSADRRTVRLLPSLPDAQLELPLLVGGESAAETQGPDLRGSPRPRGWRRSQTANVTARPPPSSVGHGGRAGHRARDRGGHTVRRRGRRRAGPRPDRRGVPRRHGSPLLRDLRRPGHGPGSGPGRVVDRLAQAWFPARSGEPAGVADDDRRRTRSASSSDARSASGSSRSR